MGRRAATRITGKDMKVVAARLGISEKGDGGEGMTTLIKSLVKKADGGDSATKETAVAMLSSLSSQNHFEYSDAIFQAGALGPLVKVLASGSAVAQGSAAAALHALARGKATHQAALVEAGGIVPLVRLLKMGSAKVQEEAASALAALDADVAHQEHVIAAGCIPPLVAMLKGSSVAAQASASKALANAAAWDMEEGQNAIVRAGAIPVLLILLSVGKAQTPAAYALAQLARFNQKTQMAIAEAGGIAPLLALLGGRNLDANIESAGALAEIARDNEYTQDAIALAGGIGPLLALLAARNSVAQSRGMAALAQLARKNQANQDAIATMGGIKPLVQLLDQVVNDPDVQAHAAFALMEISQSNLANQQMVVNSNGILQLSVLMKNSKHAEVKVEVAGALWALSEAPEIKVTIAEAEAILPLVDLLGVGGPRARQHAAAALSSLALDNEVNQVAITQMLIKLMAVGDSDAQEQAVRALWRQAHENPSAHYGIARAGDPAALVDLLKDGTPDGKDYATWSLSLSISAEIQDTVAESGGVQPLIDQMSDHRAIIQEQAALAIAKLVLDNPETRAAVCAQGGIPPLIALLDATDGDGGDAAEEVLKSATYAIANLAVEPAGRDQIVADGGIHNLVLLLQGKWSPQIKMSASNALACLSRDHQGTQAAVGDAAAIAPLVVLLSGDEGLDAQQEAAGAIVALADHKPNRQAITAADGISHLVNLLACENSTTRKHAEGALVRLSIEAENRTLIIEKLVNMLRKDTTGQEQAAAALANLARESEDNRNSIVGADGISPILSLIDSQSGKAKENAVSALTELCRGSMSNQNAIAAVGGIPKLVGVLLTVSTGGTGNQFTKDQALIHLCTLAADAIKEMAKHNPENQSSIAETGAIAPLVSFLGAPAPELQANSAGALANLARGHKDNQAAIAKVGAIAPLCALVREGSAEAKDRAAAAIWSLSTDNALNKDTIAKLGGIDPLLALLVTGTTERSQTYVSGALAALAAKHADNRALTAKRLISYLGSTAAKVGDRGIRVLMTCTAFSNDSTPNQVSIAKAGGIPTLISWLASSQLDAQEEAAHSLFCLAMDNPMTQGQIAKGGGIPPLIGLVRKSSPLAQDYAARALWHLASQPENQVIVAEAGGVRPLVGMLSAEGETASELAAIVLVRLMNNVPAVSLSIADKGGIAPLTQLMRNGSPGAQQQAAAVLAELAIVPSIRDLIANAGAIKQLIALVISSTEHTPETAARVLSHLSLKDEGGDMAETGMALPSSPDAGMGVKGAGARRRTISAGEGGFIPFSERENMQGSDERRAAIERSGGVAKLISMLDGSNLDGVETVKLNGIGLPIAMSNVGMKEQGAATLADMALNNAEMQDAIIGAGGVPHLLALIRMGSPLGQEHSARAIRNLVTFHPIDAALIDNQRIIVECGTIPDLVQLTKTGSQQAQMLAAAGISELASGAVFERETQETRKVEESKKSPPGKPQPEASSDDQSTDRLVLISEAGGITPLVTMLSTSNNLARENASGALMHLALDSANAAAIAKANGIGPLVTILDDGTETAHKYAAETILRLGSGNEENQTQAAKHLVGLLASESVGTLCRTARVLSKLAKQNPKSPVIIVNAGAIAPLVQLLSTGALEVKFEVAGALQNLSLNSPETQLAIATGLVALLGMGSAETQEHVTRLLLTLVSDPDNCAAVSRAGAVMRLVLQLRMLVDNDGPRAFKAQELAAAVLAKLSMSSEDNVDTIASSSGIRPLVALLATSSPMAQAHVSAILSDLARRSARNQNSIVGEGGIALLITILEGGDRLDMEDEPQAATTPDKAATTPDKTEKKKKKRSSPEEDAAAWGEKAVIRAKAEAAGALLCLSVGLPDTKKAIADKGAISLIVTLLDEEDILARQKAAGAIAELSTDSPENQDAVASMQGIEKIVNLLEPSGDDAVHAASAAALAALCRDHKGNQAHVPAAGGIKPLVALLQGDRAEKAKEEAAAALWSLTSQNFENQVAISKAGGIQPLVTVLGLGERAQEMAGGALAALALDNEENLHLISARIVSLLGAEDKLASAKAARAISRLAGEGSANQVAIANAGGVALLVRLLDTGGAVQGDEEAEKLPRRSRESIENTPPSVAAAGVSASIIEAASIRKEMAAAMGAMATNNPTNQIALADAGAIQLLVAMLVQPGGKADIHRVIAGALWSLTGNPGNEANQISVASMGGIVPLVRLLKSGSSGVQETCAGCLSALAEVEENRICIADAGGLPLLVEVLDKGPRECKEVAATALENLVRTSTTGPPSANKDRQTTNQRDVAHGLVGVLANGTKQGQERATQLIKALVLNEANRQAIGRAGAVPELVKQLESGSTKCMADAASALVSIASESLHNRPVTNALVMMLGSTREAVRQEASEALRILSTDAKKEHHITATRVSAPQIVELVKLLVEGLQDGRVEAQEYALRSLASITDSASRETIATSGCIAPSIVSLNTGLLSATAEEHAATVLAGLSPIETNAIEIKETGVEVLVQLLTRGNHEAKKQSAITLAQLARHAAAGSEIAEVGGASILVTWLTDSTLGPPEVGAAALSAIAHINLDTQTSIVEEGAIPSLVQKIREWSTANAQSMTLTTRTTSVGIAHRMAIVAAGTLATLSKDNMMNQLIVMEEDGIPPLLDLVRDVYDQSSHENATKALWHLAQAEENQNAIPRAGGVSPLVTLLTKGIEITQQYTAAALEALARNHPDNQLALARAGAINPLVDLLGVKSLETQQHSANALLHLAANDKGSRDAVVKRLVAVLDERNPAAQMKAAEALAILSARSNENRVAITAAQAVAPLVRLLGDGRRVKANTPQERAAAVLADLARFGENKMAIAERGAQPLVAMLASDSSKARAYAAAALGQLAAVALNKPILVDAGAIESLVVVLAVGPPEAATKAMSALWHLATVEANKASMVAAGAIPYLVTLLSADMDEAREHAVAVLSMLARCQGGNKKAIVQAQGIKPLVELLTDATISTQRNAACALWSLADGKEGVYDRMMVEQGAVEPLIQMLLANNPETCGFASACLKCLCADHKARSGIIEAGGANPLLALLNSPNTWLRGQAQEMLKLLSIPYSTPDPTASRVVSSPRGAGKVGASNQLTSPPLAAQKLLPIRQDRFIDPERDNAKVGELKPGAIAYVLERREVVPGTWRALVATESGGEPRGWVTAAKDGADFLVSESTSKSSSIVKQIKFKFFAHQMATATVDSPHFS